MATTNQERVGEAPCPCGSGKKFKKCCLGEAVSFLAQPVTDMDSDSEQHFAEGYQHFRANDFPEAARSWLKAWKFLKGRLRPRHTTLDKAQSLVPTQHDLLNWFGDFEQALHNGSLRDRSLIPPGRKFFRDWLKQFSAEELNRLSTHNVLVEFTMRDGDVATARDLLEEMLRLWPDAPWTHIFYADAYCHLFADPTHHLPFDREVARHHLQKALELAKRGYDRDAIQQRLDDLGETKPRSETCPCCPH